MGKISRFCRDRGLCKPGLLRSVLIRSTLLGPGTLLLACGLWLCPHAQAADSDEMFPIKVRSSVERPFALFGKDPEPAHSKLYAIAGIKMASRVENDASSPLVIPVDEEALRAELKHVLSARGFRETTWNKAPGIVLTVLYGRDTMPTSLDGKAIQVDNSNLGFNGTKIFVVHTVEDVVGRERSTSSYFERLKNAEGEKLFIVINAWKYLGFNPTEKPELQWSTTVLVDDPDRDLNLIAGKMLAAAGAYFDHKIDQGEVAVLSTTLKEPAEEETAAEVVSTKVSRK